MTAQYSETKVAVCGEPLDAVVRLVEAGLHEEYVVYENNGEFSYAGGVLAQVTLDRDGARSGDTVPAWNDDPLSIVRSLLSELRVDGWRAYGWAAFELSYARSGERDLLGSQRLLHLVVPRCEVRVSDGVALIRSVDPVEADAVAEVLTGFRPLVTRSPEPVDVRTSGSRAYRSAVADAVGEIKAKLLQKVILSRVVELSQAIDLPATYAAGRRANLPERSFLLCLDGVEAAGFSPEIVASVSSDGAVVSHPLAGTRALCDDEALNERYRADLLADAKEIYEHAISVKVGNDEFLSFCEPGSVHVRDLMSVKRRGSVQHLASEVAGRLADGCDAWDAFAAIFPAVTASGVPKEAAYQAIRRHETEPRGLYGGAVLTVDQSGALDAALVLRSVYRQHGRTWLRAGAGIVAQSTPDREFEETCEKLDSVARFLVPAGRGEH
ncbi:anthranilate synthase component 1/salicylate synthetase [Lentzea fradiae]|uniref:Anthranilate synthase component 1/salicylate synthetase n=1 Tax=Lentzea fradiae TaxID=200378 RepID=A0A1G7L2R8_9PSEU|nr:salicylate synthase [Lentzea fradiae]SDF43309.1 anthranilate synthase component 1/salicylate synthetase [Lentzea fradiae]